MEEITLTFHNCPVISYYQYLSSNKRYYSVKGKEFMANFRREVECQYSGEPFPSTNIECSVYIYLNNRRKNDLDNYVKPILDNLQMCGVIQDDCYITRLIVEKEIIITKELDTNCIVKLRNRTAETNISL